MNDATTLDRSVVSLYDEFAAADIPSTQNPRNTQTFSEILDLNNSLFWKKLPDNPSTEEIRQEVRKMGFRLPSKMTVNNFLRSHHNFHGYNEDFVLRNGRWYQTHTKAFKALPKRQTNFWTPSKTPKGWRELKRGERISSNCKWCNAYLGKNEWKDAILSNVFSFLYSSFYKGEIYKVYKFIVKI